MYILCADQNWAQGRLATIEENLPDGSLKRYKAPSTTDGDVSNGYHVGSCPSFYTKHPPASLVVDLRELYISVDTIYYITPSGPKRKLNNGDQKYVHRYQKIKTSKQTNKQTDGRTDRQTHKHTDTQTVRQAGKQAGR